VRLSRLPFCNHRFWFIKNIYCHHFLFSLGVKMFRHNPQIPPPPMTATWTRLLKNHETMVARRLSSQRKAAASASPPRAGDSQLPHDATVTVTATATLSSGHAATSATTSAATTAATTASKPTSASSSPTRAAVGIAGADPGDAADSFLFVGDADHRWHWGRYIFFPL
jgi:hypothetical protein